MEIIAETLPHPFDQTKRGRVAEKLPNNQYKVQLQDKVYTIKSNFSFEVNESVLVMFPQGRDTDLYLYPNR
jgi:hypothetical protein